MMNKDDRVRSQEDLTSYIVVCFITSLGALALIGLVIFEFIVDPLFHIVGRRFLEPFGLAPLWTFFCLVPLILGVVELFLCLVGVGSAALEKAWHAASLIDVIVHPIPSGKWRNRIEKLPLRCGVRLLFIRMMVAIEIFLLVASGVAFYYITNGIEILSSEGLLESSPDSPGNIRVFRSVLDFTGVIFNECCASKGWSRQGLVRECQANGDSFPCDLPSALESKTNQICPCFPPGSDEEINEYKSFVKETDTCDLLGFIHAPINKDDNIPGTNFKMGLVIPSNFTEVPVVGDMIAEYGCGAGYARGMQYALTKYAFSAVQPYVAAIMIISGFQLFVLMMGYVLTCSRPDNEEEQAIQDRLFDSPKLENGDSSPITPRPVNAFTLGSPRFKTGLSPFQSRNNNPTPIKGSIESSAARYSNGSKFALDNAVSMALVTSAAPSNKKKDSGVDVVLESAMEIAAEPSNHHRASSSATTTTTTNHPHRGENNNAEEVPPPRPPRGSNMEFRVATRNDPELIGRGSNLTAKHSETSSYHQHKKNIDDIV